MNKNTSVFWLLIKIYFYQWLIFAPTSGDSI